MSEVLLRILLRKMEKDYVSKDIIKTKIEELEKDRKDFKNNEKTSTNEREKTYWHTIVKEMTFGINVLKEMVGEDNEL